MQAILWNIPTTPEEWASFSFSHKTSHQLIYQTINARDNLNLAEYDLDPINFNDFDYWLELNQEAHNDMNGVLNLQGVDLETLDPKDQKQLQTWFYNHVLEHIAAEAALEVGS